MSWFSELTADQVIQAIGLIASDASVFLPPPASEILHLIAAEAPLIEKLLRARDAGSDTDALLEMLEQALKAASDAEMKKELGGG